MCLQTLQYLQQNAKERADLAANAAAGSSSSFIIPATTSKISMQELEELRRQLGSMATNSSVQQVFSFSWAKDTRLPSHLCTVGLSSLAFYYLAAYLPRRVVNLNLL